MTLEAIKNIWCPSFVVMAGIAISSRKISLTFLRKPTFERRSYHQAAIGNQQFEKLSKEIRTSNLSSTLASFIEAPCSISFKVLWSRIITPFAVRVFLGNFPWPGGVEDDESVEVDGHTEGVHFEAGHG